MPEYLSPGVYVEEIDAGPKPIAPVATSTAGAVGVTRRGPETPTLVTTYGDFARQFGGPLDMPDDATRGAWANRGHYWHAAESVKAFFDEGGALVYFQRVVPGGAAASSGAFQGGLRAALLADVGPADTQARFSHLAEIGAGDTLTFISDTGSTLGTGTVSAIDPVSGTVTFAAALGFSARRYVDAATITAVSTQDILTARAASRGAWGDEISVRIMPMVGAVRTLGATPTRGNRVSSTTTADAAAGDTTIAVTTVAGGLDGSTPPAPFRIQVNGGAAVEVSAVSEASGEATLTIPALDGDLPAGSTVTVLRAAQAGAVLTVVGADRLYPGAIVQLAGAAGTETAVVGAVSGAEVTLGSAPGNAYHEGDTLRVIEAEVTVRHVAPGGEETTEPFAGLRLTDDADPSSLIAGVNLQSDLIRLEAGVDYDAQDLARFPAAAAPWVPLTGGDDALGSLSSADFIGVNLGPGNRTGIQSLEEIDQVAICIAPGMWDVDVRNALIVHCSTLADRFAILDPPPGLSVQEIEAFRAPIDTTYAALYYPWVQIRDPRPTGAALDVPPSGFMAGIYARTDMARGVHKAPANELMRSIRGFSQTITKREQGILNPQNINVLRAFQGRGNRVWGSRVITSDSAWRDVPVRRLFLMIEESIDEATQWVVFEPNGEPLWARVRQSVTRFLISQWRLGALQGVIADQAFFVACDRSTMTQDDIDSGRLICEIGIAPVHPAEFVIFRIQQKTREIPV